jgi:hypothetical protein
MLVRPDGNGVSIYWPSPVKGRYTLAVSAKNSFGLSSKLSIPVTINAI